MRSDLTRLVLGLSDNRRVWVLSYLATWAEEDEDGGRLATYLSHAVALAMIDVNPNGPANHSGVVIEPDTFTSGR
jgi:hypothetical protein